MASFLDFAVDTAREAGKILMGNYGKMQTIEWKLKNNFKTQVDDKSDRLIRERITAAFPGHSIYSEEADAVRHESEYSWVVDPLDGTIPYTCGASDHFSVCIALTKGNTPVLGVVYAPLRNELYTAEEGTGAFCNGARISVGSNSDINRAMVCYDLGKGDRGKILPIYAKLISDEGVTYPASYACASVAMCLAAKGNLDAYLFLNLEPWDMAAAVVILKEAGAKVTDINGNPWRVGEPSVLTANPALHANLMRFLQEGGK